MKDAVSCKTLVVFLYRYLEGARGVTMKNISFHNTTGLSTLTTTAAEGNEAQCDAHGNLDVDCFCCFKEN